MFLLVYVHLLSYVVIVVHCLAQHMPPASSTIVAALVQCICSHVDSKTNLAEARFF